MANYDICVIGAGPSGAAIARRLVQFGYTVVIVEKEVFPRSHIGISMSPAVLHWLDILGVGEEVERAGFIQAASTILLWENDEHIVKDKIGGFHADRGIFDQILLNAAVAVGATLVQPCTQISVEENSNSEWKITAMKISFTAKFIVEATGRKSILKRTKSPCLSPTLATYAYWNIQSNGTSFIEAGRNHWYWASPAANGLLACVFSAPKDVKSHTSIENYYLARVKEFSLVSFEGKNFSGVSVCSATAYVDDEPVSYNYIKVGDAAFSTDPLSAQGVQKALKSAVQGAIVVNTILSGNAEIAIAFYKQLIRTEVNKNVIWAKHYYNKQNRYQGGEFWEERKSNPTDIIPEKSISVKKTSKFFIHPNASVITVPVISETYIIQTKGVMIKGNEEPFVFINGFPVASLITALHGSNLVECLMVIKSIVPNSDPMQLLKWLIYNKILIKDVAR